MTVTDRAAPAASAGRAGPPDEADDVRGGPSWLADLRRRSHERLWPISALLAALATAAMLASQPGRYVGDNRYELYANPARRVARSFMLWDGSRGLGRVREDFWPAQTLVSSTFRGLGASTMVAEHLFHATVLTAMGVGVVSVVRLFRPRIGLEHLLAALVSMFGAFSAAFLLPSNLYLHVAMAPWLVVVAYRGIHSEHRWRWAAAFALVVFAPGNADLPGVAYNLVPLLSLLVFVLVIDRTARVRDVVAWAVRAGPLALWVSLAILTKTYFAAAALGQRLNDTEVASAAALASSWPESLRGLGSWLSYYPREQGLLKPQGEVFFTSTWVILATFVPPIVAVATIAWSRWRVRLLFGMMALVSLTVMVGAYPLDDQAPFGRVLLTLLGEIPTLAAFRNTYKIGAGMVLGTAVLFGVGATWGLRRLRVRNRWLARAGGVALVLVLAGMSVPFWTGGVYDPKQTSGPVPGYWSDALQWLDAQPEGERALVLPEGSRLGYRWGWVGDDIFDALLARDHGVATGVPLSTAMGASMLEAVSRTTNDPVYQIGTLAPVAQRLGIDTVVLRNDVDWRALRQPRPADYRGLRSDPDWVRVAAFGRPGENTTAETDFSTDAQYERNLPPVEVYALRDGADGIRAASTGTANVVAGDGYAWPAMAAAGLLADDRPALPSGDLTAEQLRTQLADGGALVLTDTNRRRLRVLVGFEPDYSHTLADAQDLDRVTQTLFPAPASQTVAWFPDASAISATGTARSVSGSTPWARPSMAFDGNPLTSWQIRRLDGAGGRRLRVDLREATPMSSMRIVPARIGGFDGITGVRIWFSDGTSEDVDLRDGAATATFPTRITDWFEVEVTEVTQEGGEVVGITDITVPGLDLREFAQAPEDLFRRGDADPELARLLAEAPATYLFERVQSVGTPDEESTIRRRFRSAGEHVVAITGTFRARPATSDEQLGAILDVPLTATSVRRFESDLEAWAGYAVDGDPSTGWLGPPVQGNAITLRTDPRQVGSVRVVSTAVPGFTPIDTIEVRVGDQVASAPMELQEGCDPAAPAAECRYVADIELLPTTTDRIEVVVGEVGGPDASLGGKVRIDEIQLDGQPNPRLDDLDERFGTCLDLGIELETSPGEVASVPVRLLGTPAQVLAGTPVPFEACETVELAPGWHALEATENAPIDRIQLITTDPAPPVGEVTSPPVEVLADDPTGYTVRTEVDGSGVVVLTESYDPRWRAVVDGEPIGRSLPYDGLNGWRVEGDGPVTIELSYPPQRAFRLMLALTLIGVAVCAWLLLRRPAPRPAAAGAPVVEVVERAPDVVRPVSLVALGALVAVGAVMGFAMVGIDGALLAPAVVFVGWTWRREPGRPIATIALALVALAALATVVEVRPSVEGVGLVFTRERPVANQTAALGGALLAVAIVVLAYTERAAVAARRRALWRRPAWLGTDLPARLVPAARRMAPWAALLVLAVAVRIVGAPAAVPDALAGLVRNLRFGTVYGVGQLWEGNSAEVPPLAAGLLAYGPFGARLAVTLASLAAAVVACRLAYVKVGRSAALATGAVAAVLPSLWAQPLALVLAAGLVAGATALADPDRIDARRGALAGVAAGAAAMAAPDAVVVAPVLLAWLALDLGRSGRKPMAALAVAAVVVQAPWWSFVAGEIGVPAPAPDWSSFVLDGLSRPSLPVLLALLVGAVVVGVAVRELWDVRDSWRQLLPFIVLLAWNVVLGVATVGERDLLGWAAPLAAVVLGASLSGWVERSLRPPPPVVDDDGDDHLFA